MRECESENSHRYGGYCARFSHSAVTGFLVQNKNFSGNGRASSNISRADIRSTSDFYTGISLEFGKDCEDLSWNHRTSTSLRSQTNGIPGLAVRRVKEGTSAIPLQSGLDEKVVGIFHGMLRFCAQHSRPPIRREQTPSERRFGEPFNGPIKPFGSMVQHQPVSAKDQERLHQFGKKVLPATFLGYALHAVGILARRYPRTRQLRNNKIWTHQKSMLADSMQEKYSCQSKEMNFYSRECMPKSSCEEKIKMSAHLRHSESSRSRGRSDLAKQFQTDNLEATDDPGAFLEIKIIVITFNQG